jgi:dCMP deaminase
VSARRSAGKTGGDRRCAPEGFLWQNANGVSVLVPEFFRKLRLAGGYSLRRAADGRELDLDLRGGKDRRSILENRRLVSHAMGIDPARLVVGEQVHGAGNAVAGPCDAGRGARAPEEVVPGVDALLTSDGDVPLATLSADCVLVLMADERRRAAGSVHSGWPGTVAGAVPAAVEAFGRLKVKPRQIYAALGPSIRSCCYEVGEDLRAKFAARFAWAGEVFTTRAGRLYLDLPGAVKRQLVDAGVRPERIFDAGLCTACDLESFYSFRKEGRAAGRIAGVIEIMGKKGTAKSAQTVKRIGWDEYFLLLAKLAACRSTCLSRPTGAVIVRNRQVMATGYNGSVPGGRHCIDDGVCYRRSVGATDAEKLSWCRASHAEANAVAQAARAGISIEGSTLYTTLSPCFVCAKLIASSGIRRVVYEHTYESASPDRDRHWADTLKEAGVETQQLHLGKESVARAVSFIEGDTSVRRLKSQ